MSQIRFEPSSLARAADGVDGVAQQISRATESLYGRVSDASVVGDNDTFGRVAADMYRDVLEQAKRTIDSVLEAYGGHAEALHRASRAYRRVEEDNTELSGGGW
ncbi:WXG100 family type VII secretion target [Enemella sp. A6]|uniref:WXG100 family type VII secretion target n=1 Tax=Enemella sp. A6 TaxID=3440152 RepID=UPI003EBB6408